MNYDFDKLKLCYIDQEDEYSERLELYFTEQDLDKQWGDDWDDTPYEHNAGTPYTEDYSKKELRVENGRGIYPKINIYKIFLDTDDYEITLITPRTGTINSNYSVRDINEGTVPWLVIKKLDKIVAKIMAGTTYNEFIEICKNIGSIKVYEQRLFCNTDK